MFYSIERQGSGFVVVQLGPRQRNELCCDSVVELWRTLEGLVVSGLISEETQNGLLESLNTL